MDASYKWIIVLLIVALLGLSGILYYLLKESYVYQPIVDNDYIDIFNNEEIQLRRGSTARVSVPPTVRQALYADKGLIIPTDKNCLCE